MALRGTIYITVCNGTNWKERKKKKCMILKVDYEKMYDSICWKFLFYMMRRLCFDKIWIGWMYGCLSTSSVFILVNGSPLREFKLQRDLRQDNPLAPFLFTMVVEGLSGMTREACHKNLLWMVKGGSWSRGELVAIY